MQRCIQLRWVLRRRLGEFGDGLLQRLERPQVQLGVRPSLPLVAVDHLRGAMAGPVGDPRLVLPDGQVNGHEARPQIVGTQRESRVGPFEELRPRDAGLGESAA